ncbi:T9SS type B sorting domain-containing protein, partial [Flavobacterium amnicola]
ADGISTISNYNATYTYNFLPPGPTVGTTGIISGMTVGASYTVNASLGTCNSPTTLPFFNAPMAVAPVAPTINSIPATCSSDEISTIANYNAAYAYTFTPPGPTVGAGGLINGMTAGTSYTVVANNGCDSPSSLSFNNQVMLVTPVTPTISPTPATCTADGISTISNYNATYTYNFLPPGPTVGTTGIISGMTVGASYTVNASLGTCNSPTTLPFFNAPMFPTPTLVVTNPAAVCFPSTVDITGTAVFTGSPAGGTPTFWTNASATTSLPNAAAITTSGTYYIKYELNGCSDIQPVVVTINKTPAPIVNPVSYCLNDMATSLTATGSNLLWYTTSTGGTGSSTAPTPLTTSVGSTTYYVSQTLNGCESDRAAIVVTVSQPPVSAVIQPLPYFSDINTITVTVDPPGVYEYSLDGGPFQNSNVFYNVPSGTHNVVVKNSCATLPPTPTTIVNYPKYFTPNADGIHDNWNIPFLSSQSDSKIEIFDRFGKLITVIQPSGNGWDGTYSNQQLPSTDYWFVVYYKEDGVSKTHKAHFAMKR